MANPSNVQTWKVLETFQVSHDARIGHTAQEILRAPGFSGDVLAVVTHAVYLTTPRDEILWLAQTQLPAHARAILALYDSRTIRVGMNARVENERVIIGNGSIDLRDAEEWQPPAITQPAPLNVVKERVVLAQSVLRGAKERDEAISKAILDERFGDCFAQTARNDIHTIRNLIGLGAGLTPAGDDFVGGLFFAAHYLRKTYPESFDWDAQIIDELIEYARTQTNRISFAILCDLVRGQGPDPLHAFIVALLSNKEADDIQSSITQVLAIGHTTGRVMLEGVLTGIELMLERRAN